MTLVQVGDFEIDARPYVEEAMLWFGTIRPGKEEDFLTAFVQCQRNGSGYRGICGMGRRMTWQERKSLGISMSPFTWEAFDLVIEEARKDVVDTLMNVTLRALFRIQKRWHCLALASVAADIGPYTRPMFVEFEINGFAVCELAEQISGVILPWQDDFELPLRGCSVDLCRCDVRMLTRDRYKAHVKRLRDAV